jgi:hypothetical protein
MIAVAIASGRADGRSRRPVQPLNGCGLIAAPPAEMNRPLQPKLYRSLVRVVAHELWRQHGGNDVLNWLEAEILVQNALGSHELMNTDT